MPRRDPPGTFVVTPEGWLSRGEALVRGRDAQLAIFGGIPGERAKVRVFSSDAHQDRARWIAAESPHPGRVQPPCEKWGPCGGCSWMHLSRDARADAHRQVLAEAMVAAGFDAAATREATAEPVLAPEAGERHAIELVSAYSDRGAPRLGALAREGRGAVAIPGCMALHPDLAGLLTVANHEILEHAVWPADRHPQTGATGTLRRLRAWRAPSGDMLVALDVARTSKALEATAERIGARIPAVRGVLAHDRDEPVGTLYGVARIEIVLGGVGARGGIADPLPVHPGVEARAIEDLVADLGAGEGAAPVDIGLGLGVRTLALARAAGWALALDDDPGRVARVRDDARRQKIPAECFAGSPLAELADARTRLRGRRVVAHLELERKSLDAELAEAVRALDPAKVALSSSNPRALARTAADWARSGYRLERLRCYELAGNGPLAHVVAVVARQGAESAPARGAPRRRVAR